ncbi:hypothetical protein ScPMuIL_006350 [Solemya velum]
MENTTIALLAGRVHPEHIPHLPTRVVRVYLSAAGQDTSTERDVFVQEVYPRLREYCRRQYGLEFQVVDLGWGTAGRTGAVEVFDDFRLRELERCKELSAGPNFIAIVGQRYGCFVLPSRIPYKEYDLIRTALHSQKSKDARSAHQLDEWFIRDNNSIPPVYELKQPRMSKDEDEANCISRAWSEQGFEIQRLVQRGVDACYHQGLMDAETRDRYFMSAQEYDSPVPSESNRIRRINVSFSVARSWT